MSPAPIRSTDKAFDIFGDPLSTVEQRAQALTALITQKILPKQADDPRVLQGREALSSRAVQADLPAERLWAIAESIRLGQVVKRWQPEIHKALAPAFNSPLPALQLLIEADDRLNVARACAVFSPPWMPAYLAESIATEAQGEKARAELLSTLLAQSDTLNAAITLLSKTFSQQRPATRTPGETLAARLTSTIQALRPLIVDSDKPAGEELGDALYTLLKGSFVAIGRPQEGAHSLTEAVVLMVHDILRTRMSIIADPAMYRVIGYCRELFPNKRWPETLERPLARVIGDISEAILLLGRQGQMDQVLISQLDILCNYPERAKAICRNIAEGHPELPESVREWLLTGKLRAQLASDAAVEVAAGTADAAIGLALQVARRAEQATNSMTEPLLSALELFEPDLMSVTEEFLKSLQPLFVQVQQAASLRQLSLLGLPGEEIEYAVKFFDVVGGNPRQRMVVRQPAVVRMRDDGSPGSVILKGLVE